MKSDKGPFRVSGREKSPAAVSSGELQPDSSQQPAEAAQKRPLETHRNLTQLCDTKSPDRQAFATPGFLNTFSHSQKENQIEQ